MFSLSSAHSSAGVGPPAQVPGGVQNRNFVIENPVPSREETAFQVFSDAPIIGAPPYGSDAIFHSYGGDFSQLRHANLPSGVGGASRCFSLSTASHLRFMFFSPSFSLSSAHSSANDHYRLYAGPPAQVPSGIPNRSFAIENPVPFRQDTTFQASNSTPIIVAPPYGSHAIARSYEGNARGITGSSTSTPTGFYDPGQLRLDQLPYDQASPRPPSSSSSSIPASRTDTPYLSAHHPTPSADHTYQTLSLREHGSQQPGAPQIFNVDGCFVDGDDLTDLGTIDGCIIIGQCRRTDSPCNLWVKANTKSLKRHAQKWHGVARGGEKHNTPCMWAGCNREMQKGAVPRHTLCQHFNETFTCKGCSKPFTRRYGWESHAKTCEFSSYGCRVMYGPGIRAINVQGMSLG